MFLKKHKTFLKDVLMYTLTSFGGPQGHLGMMLKTFVQKKKYLSEEEFFEFNSICQILPGASSTQLLGTIGYKKGGIALSILTLLIWITPASILLGLLSFYVNHQSNNTNTNEFFKYVQPMVIGFIFFTTYISAKKNINNKITFIITLITTILMYLFFKSPWIFPLLFILSAITTNLSNKRFPPKDFNPNKKIKWTNLYLFVLVFLLAGFLSESSRTKNWEQRKFFNLFENFYRFGSIVFGGGDVLLPLTIDQYVARPENKQTIQNNPGVIKINKEDLLKGYAIVKAIPGPVFSYAAYLGGLSMKNEGRFNQLLGCVIGTIAIFLPSVFMIFFLLPIWSNFKNLTIVYRSLEGINATIVGIMLATAIYLIIQIEPLRSSYLLISNACIIICTFCFLAFTKIPPSIVVLFCLLIGWIF